MQFEHRSTAMSSGKSSDVCVFGFFGVQVFSGGGGRVDTGLLEQIIKLVTFRENLG